MIELKHGMSRRRIYASRVSCLDIFIPATYQHYEGEINSRPIYSSCDFIVNLKAA